MFMNISGLIMVTGVGATFVGLTIAEKLGVKINHKLVTLTTVTGIIITIGIAIVKNPLMNLLP
jgi:hypothetical protein